MYSFSLRSATPAGEKSGPGPYRFPLIAASADGTVQVRRDGYRLHTAKAEVWVFVVLRLPGRPTGLASMMVFGKQASAAPSKVMASWTRCGRSSPCRVRHYPPWPSSASCCGATIQQAASVLTSAST